MRKIDIQRTVDNVFLYEGIDDPHDGSKVIAEFVWACMQGDGEVWMKKYNDEHKPKE